MSCDPHLFIRKRLSASAACLISLFSAIPCAGAGTSERDIALLLGHESMALFYSDVRQPLVGHMAIDSRLQISDYLSDLGVVGVSYPTNPVGTPENPAALASYGQTVIDSLDDVQSAAFVVGWYGAIFLADDSRPFPASIVCEYAPRAEFSDVDCDLNTRVYLERILEQARASTE